MRITRQILEKKLENYNRLGGVQLKFNNDVVGGVNLYTEGNERVATGTSKEISLVLDALTTIKHLERKEK